MEARLFGLLEAETPKFNREITDGLACKDLLAAKDYIDRIIRCAEQQYPEGLEYVGSERCSPLEEYNEITQVRSGSPRVFDLARSDVYLVKYKFRYKGEDLFPRYLYLPYVRQGGLIYIMGKQFSISPVLADPVFSVGMDDIFIPVPRGKITFNQEPHSHNVNGVRVPKYVVWSPLHNRGAKKNKTSRSSNIQLGRVYSTLMHYLLCRFGFEETFRLYGKCEVQVMTEQEAEAISRDEYVVCSSSKIRPKGVRVRDYALVASDLALVVRKEDYTPLVESMVAGFFYVVDHFPDSMTPELVHTTWQWKVLMGYVLFGDEPSHGKLVENVESHLKSLDGYVDFEARDTLKKANVECQHIYDLFAHILDKMPQMLHESSGKVSSMYDKQFMILRYVLSDINNAIFEFLFKIISNDKKQLNTTILNNILADHFKPKTILKISAGKGHGYISSVSSPSDNKFFKITSNLVPQSDTAGTGKGQETKPIDPSMFLDASWAEIGSYCWLPKSNPYGTTKANPFQLLGEFGKVERNPRFIDLLDSVQAVIGR